MKIKGNMKAALKFKPDILPKVARKEGLLIKSTFKIVSHYGPLFDINDGVIWKLIIFNYFPKKVFIGIFMKLVSTIRHINVTK